MSDPFPQQTAFDEDLWSSLLSYPGPEVFHPGPEVFKPFANPDFIEPLIPSNKSETKPAIIKKLIKGRGFNDYFKPKMQNIFQNLTYLERCHMINRLFDVLSCLELPIEDYISVFEDYYYDVETKEFEPFSKVYEEFENNEVFLLEEYEREYKGLVLVSNIEREFWENNEQIMKKDKKKTKKRRKSPHSNFRGKIQRLMEERDEFFNTNAYFSHKHLKESDVKCNVKKNEKSEQNGNKSIADEVSKGYGLRERQKTLLKLKDEEEIDKEEAYVFNKRFKMKYYELLKQNRKGVKEEKPPSPVKLVVLPEKILHQKIEDNLALQIIKQKNNFPSCFIEEKQKEEEKEVNSKTETVKLTDLGEKFKRNYTKKKEKKIKTNQKKIKKSQIKKQKKKITEDSEASARVTRKQRKRKPLIKEMIDIENDESKEQKPKTNIIWEFDFNLNEI